MLTKSDKLRKRVTEEREDNGSILNDIQHSDGQEEKKNMYRVP